jgi:hypothetical protein
MSMPKISRLRDMVVAMLPQGPRPLIVLTQEEADLGPHLRGNQKLYDALVNVVRARLSTRENQPVPADPLDCRAVMERNHELRWLLARLDAVYRSQVNQTADDGEQPA